MNRKRVFFATLVIALLILLMMEPVLAEDAYDTHYELNYYRVAWGNGIDDDGDGVIDNFGEPDVEYGDLDVNFTDNVLSEWNDTMIFGENNETFDQQNGVAFIAHWEQLWQIDSSTNASVSPTVYPYEFIDNSGDVDNPVSYYEISSHKCINAVTFYLNFSAEDLMNGCQEMWYRSPICYDTDVYEDGATGRHFLNIYNEDNELVFASRIWSSGTNDYCRAGVPIFKSDASVANTSYTRIYYRLQFDLRTDQKYRFEEFVETKDDAAINSVKLFMSPNQDKGDDELTDTYVFWGSAYARKIPVEAGWGIIATIGIGNAGTEKIIWGGPTNTKKIYTQNITGSPLIDDVGSVTVILPLRTSTILDIHVQVITYSGGSSHTDSETVDDVAGTFIYTLNITDPDAGEPNNYSVVFTIWELDVGDVMCYTMYPSPGVAHLVLYNGGNANFREYVHYAVHCEIREHAEVAAIEEGKTQGPDAIEFLLGVGLIIVGIIVGLLVITAPISATMTAVGLAFASGSIFIGSTMVVHSFTSDAGLANYPGWLASGLVRAAKAVWDGIVAIGTGLWNAVVAVWEAIKNLGSALFYWGGIILSAIVDIIYFCTAVFIWWLMAKFLSIMSAVRDGNVEQITTRIIQVEGSLRSGIRQRAGEAKGIYRKGRKIINRRRE